MNAFKLAKHVTSTSGDTGHRHDFEFSLVFAHLRLSSGIGCSDASKGMIAAQPAAGDVAAKLLRSVLERPLLSSPTAVSDLLGAADFAHIVCSCTAANDATAEGNCRDFIRGGGPRLLVRALEWLTGDCSSARYDGLCIDAQFKVLHAIVTIATKPPLSNARLLTQFCVAGGALAALTRLALALTKPCSSKIDPGTGAEPAVSASVYDALQGSALSTQGSASFRPLYLELSMSGVYGSVVATLGLLIERIGGDAAAEAFSCATAEALLCASCYFWSSGIDTTATSSCVVAAILLIDHGASLKGALGAGQLAKKAAELGVIEAACTARAPHRRVPTRLISTQCNNCASATAQIDSFLHTGLAPTPFPRLLCVAAVNR
jgi:hypothetical protein